MPYCRACCAEPPARTPSTRAVVCLSAKRLYKLGFDFFILPASFLALMREHWLENSTRFVAWLGTLGGLPGELLAKPPSGEWGARELGDLSGRLIALTP